MIRIGLSKGSSKESWVRIAVSARIFKRWFRGNTFLQLCRDDDSDYYRLFRPLCYLQNGETATHHRGWLEAKSRSLHLYCDNMYPNKLKGC